MEQNVPFVYLPKSWYDVQYMYVIMFTLYKYIVEQWTLKSLLHGPLLYTALYQNQVTSNQ